jgi:hypothetical protein
MKNVTKHDLEKNVYFNTSMYFIYRIFNSITS